MGYGPVIESLIETCEFLILNGHNTEFTNPYKYAISTLIGKAKIVHKIKADELRNRVALESEGILSAIGGALGGKDGYKNFQKVMTALRE